MAPATGTALKGTRRVFTGGGWHEAGVWDRDSIAAADTITGPAIIEEAFATHFIAPGWTARLGTAGAIIAVREAV